MAETEPEQRVSKKVVYENVTSTGKGTSAVAWVIIAVLAIALLAYILVQMF